MAVAAETLRAEGRVSRVLLLDLDVHQARAGTGRAARRRAATRCGGRVSCSGSKIANVASQWTAAAGSDCSVVLTRGCCSNCRLQGDGTAACFANRSDVFTLSVHAASNFPARKQTSSLDIALPDCVGDAEYLAAVASALHGTLRDFKPDLCIYDAGVDVHQVGLGRLQGVVVTLPPHLCLRLAHPAS